MTVLCAVEGTEMNERCQRHRETVPVPIKKLTEAAQPPQYMHEGDSGADLFSISHYVIKPGQRATIRTGIAAQIPSGFELQIRTRSGLAAKHGIVVLNSPGTIDSSYEGEIKVILYNAGDQPFHVVPGQRIAQIVLCPVATAQWCTRCTTRHDNGFGSTNGNAEGIAAPREETRYARFKRFIREKTFRNDNRGAS